VQSSLTLRNSSSSEFTLTVMSVVSILVPFVLAYIAYCWYKMDRRKLTSDELDHTDEKY
jgi:cytochrome d ubiquinol oxidase subunit II